SLFSLFFFVFLLRPPCSTLFPYTTLFRSYVNILPTKNMALPVDKDSVIRNRAVPVSWQNDIADALRWTYNKSYVTKAELSMLSIILNNNWESPIYFANMLRKENVIGLDKYLVNEGLLYQLMPIEKGQPEETISLVNTDTIYRNIKTKYAFGNISQMKHFEVDYRRFVQSYLFDNTINVALDTLLAEERLGEAKEIALLAVKHMPQHIVDINHVYSNATVVDTLLKVEEKGVAEKIVTRNIDYINNHLDYLLRKGNRLTAIDQMDMQTTVDSFNRYREIAFALDNKQLMAQIKRMDDRYFKN